MSELIKNPHDRTTKAILTDLQVAKAFFEVHLPEEIKKVVDLRDLKVCKGSFVDKKLREYLTDILYQTRVRDKTGYLYLLLEAQSTPDRMMPFRLLQYQINIMKHYRDEQEKKGLQATLPFVYPMVYYTGSAKYHQSTDLFSLFDEPDLARDHFLKPFQLIDLSQIEDDELKRHAIIRGLELVQKHIHVRDMSLLLEDWLKEGIFLEIEGQGGEYLEILLSYMLGEGEAENTDAFLKALQNQLTVKRDKIMTMAQQLEQKGIQKGIYKSALLLFQKTQNFQLVKDVFGEKLNQDELMELKALEKGMVH